MSPQFYIVLVSVKASQDVVLLQNHQKLLDFDFTFFFKFLSGGATSHNNLDPHAEVLLALNKTCPDWTAQWLRAGLENQKNLAAVVLQKDNITRILRERTNRGRLCEVLKEFSIQSRQKTGL